MGFIALQIKASLENVAKISLPEDHEYCITVKDSQGDDTRERVRVSTAHVEELAGSRGTANFALKWAKDSKHSAYMNIVPAKDKKGKILKDYTAADDGKFVSIIAFDCRGLEPTAFHPEDGFLVETTSGAKFENVDLSQGEWSEYDEKLGEPVGIYELESQFVNQK